VSANIALKIPVVWSLTLCIWYTCSTRFRRIWCIHYQCIHLPDGYSEVLRDVNKLLPDYAESHPRRQ